MQEYNDGSFGEIKDGAELLKELSESPLEMEKTRSIHFGSVEQLEKKKSQGAFGGNGETKDGTSVKEYLRRVEDKLDMIIKHFNIVHIIGQGE